MTPLSIAELLAAKIERQDGLRCGKCGRPHVGTVDELSRTEDACHCQCCWPIWEKSCAEWFEADFPDLITIQGGQRVITSAAVSEAIRRMEAELAELETAVTGCGACP